MQTMSCGKFEGVPLAYVPTWAIHWECRFHRLNFSADEHSAMAAELRRREHCMWTQRRRDTALMRRRRTR